MERLKRYLFALILACLLSAPVGLLGGASTLEWDSRLDALGVALVPAEDCEAGCWKLITARYEDDQQSGGNHNIYARLYNESGDMIAGVPWVVSWPDGNVTIYSKAPPEWADFPIFACYLPDTQRGAYSAYAGDDPTRSDVVQNMGLPACYHVNFRLEWQYQPATAPCVGCIPRAYLPFLRAQ